jgi:benzylsuccinate CoA-transferase BbsF subunit
LQEFDWQSYSPITVRDEDLAEIEEAFAAFFASKPMGELYDEALRRRILLAPCNDAREIVDQAQLQSRGLFREVDHPELGVCTLHPDFFAKLSRSQIRIRNRAPQLGEHDDAPWSRERSPLRQPIETNAPPRPVFEGLKLLELGAGAAGPVATGYFAEHGAHVIRIESAARPDFLRMLHLTAANRNEPEILERAPMFVLLNSNKDSLTLNMKEARAVEIVKKLAAWADVVSENFAPGVMEKWGLDVETLRAINPRLVAVSGCLFGQTGPQRSYPGFGGQGSAIAGFNHLTGRPDGDAHGPYATITDSLAPRYVATAIVAALLERDRSGEGQAIDVSQIETGVYSLAEIVVRYSANGEVECRRGNRHEFAAPHGVYPCRGDDRWIAIAVHDDADWARFASALGSPDWVTEAHQAVEGRLADQDSIDERIAEWTAGFNCDELMASLQAQGVEACAVQNFADLQEDPQLEYRGHWVNLSHAHLGELRFERSGFRLSESPGAITRPGPMLGEHNREILEGIVGLSSDELDTLTEAGVVA